jgi:hypothetical protein
MLTKQMRTMFGVKLSAAEETLNGHEHQTGFTQRALRRWRAILRLVFGLYLSKGSGSSGGGGCCG